MLEESKGRKRKGHSPEKSKFIRFKEENEMSSIEGSNLDEEEEDEAEELDLNRIEREFERILALKK